MSNHTTAERGTELTAVTDAHSDMQQGQPTIASRGDDSTLAQSAGYVREPQPTYERFRKSNFQPEAACR